MEQVQCHNCGGYKVYTQAVLEPVETDRNANLLGAVTIISWLITGVSFFFGALTIKAALEVFTYTLPITIVLTLFVFGYGMMKGQRKGKLLHYHNRCNICGLQWQWVPGTSRPAAQM